MRDMMAAQLRERGLLSIEPANAPSAAEMASNLATMAGDCPATVGFLVHQTAQSPPGWVRLGAWPFTERGDTRDAFVLDNSGVVAATFASPG